MFDFLLPAENIACRVRQDMDHKTLIIKILFSFMVNWSQSPLTRFHPCTTKRKDAASLQFLL